MKPEDFYAKLIGLINKHNVEFLIVDGYAVIAHGYIRATTDMDIWVNTTKDNGKNIRKALEEMGYKKEKCLKAESIVNSGGKVKVFMENNKIDLMATYSTYLKFEDSYKTKKEVELENVRFYFIGYKELIETKLRAGRTRDLDDVKNLKALHKSE